MKFYKNENRKWFHHHVENARSAEAAPIKARFAEKLREMSSALAHVNDQISRAKADCGAISNFLSSFGVYRENYRLRVLPLLNRAASLQHEIVNLKNQERTAVRAAESLGEKEYRIAHSVRKQEAAQAKERRRIRYLERSPAIRSAAKSLKQVLIGEQAKDDGIVECFYCSCAVAIDQVHIEHKHPVSRGGSNKRSNLVLSCSRCNLRKGRKTHHEFIKTLK